MVIGEESWESRSVFELFELRCIQIPKSKPNQSRSMELSTGFLVCFVGPTLYTSHNSKITTVGGVRVQVQLILPIFVIQSLKLIWKIK